MYTSLHIQGFRCFRDLKIEKLARINLIGGKNNTGKTALLEALYLAAVAGSDPDTCLQHTHALRGLDATTAGRLGYEQLFTDFDPDGSAEITVVSEAEAHAVKLQGDRFHQHVSIDVDGKATGFAYFKTSLGGGRAAEGASVPCRLLGSRDRMPDEEVGRLFGDLQVTRQTGRIVSAVSHLEPDVLDLRWVGIRGGSDLLHADVGEGRPLLPLALLGEGMNRIVTILLAVSSAANGILLIDEIENGLHYSVMRDVWKAIASAARDLDVQVFATTHSDECIQAAYEAVPAEDLLYHRLDRVDGEVECVTYQPDTLDAALDMPAEVR